MTNMDTVDATASLAVAADSLYEVRPGVTFPAAYALMTRADFNQFGGDTTDLAHIAVKNHENALANNHAHLQTEIAVDDVIEAPAVADPLGLYDACPISDGASAVVLTTDVYAQQESLEAPVTITGSGQGGNRMALQDRDSFAKTSATRDAAEEAYDDANVSPADIDVAEVHDCFTIAEVLALEAPGLYEDGEAIGANTSRRDDTRRSTPGRPLWRSESEVIPSGQQVQHRSPPS